MPVYNGERYIRDALDALLAQTYTDFELIISDNASTDRTGAICEAYAARDARIRYIRQPENIGATANFRYVLDRAEGGFFMWAAYDDWWKPDFIARAVAAMQDGSVGFAFPTTIVKSIHLGVYKRIPRAIFRGFEDADRNRRVLSFANLHQYSYKCNLVYSLFRTGVIRKAMAGQDMANEFLVCMVVLGETRGAVLEDYDFYKRYPYRWPGVRRRRPVKAKRRIRFEKWRDETTSAAKALFPEICSELELIRLQHKPASYQPGFEIVKGLLARGAANE
jgi:glycosyltransferase involved in cell wall biosynthesis